MNELQSTFNRLLAQSGKSVTQVATLGRVDRAYLKRLLAGEKDNPSLEQLMRIWIGLCMDAKVAREHPDFPLGLAELLEAAAMSSAPFKVAEEKSR